MANDVNENAHSTNPRATITTDIRPTPIGENASLFNHSNLITIAKFHGQTQNHYHHHQQQQPTPIAKITPKQQQQHEATQPVTAYNDT